MRLFLRKAVERVRGGYRTSVRSLVTSAGARPVSEDTVRERRESEALEGDLASERGPHL